VNDIVRQKRALSPEMALVGAFGVSSYFVAARYLR